jgi:Sulfotransferase family
MMRLQQVDTPSPVFLLAPARSYSTVSLALLAGHPGIYGFPEMLLFASRTVRELISYEPKPWQPPAFVEDQRSGILRAVADLRERSQEEAAIQRAEKWLTAHSAWSPRQLMDHLLELAYPQIGLEKSPETVLTGEALKTCLDSYPQACYIHLTRHPVTTMRSAIEHMRPWTDCSEKALIAMAASAWYLGHARAFRALAQLPARQWVRIRAEDLLRDPAGRLPPLLRWLGLPADDHLVARMMHTENWRFAGTGPSGRLSGGDPKFMRSPVLRPIPEPGEVVFEESWGLPAGMSARLTDLAAALGYRT